MVVGSSPVAVRKTSFFVQCLVLLSIQCAVFFETATKVFFCEFSEVFKNIFSTKHLWEIASVFYWKKKKYTLQSKLERRKLIRYTVTFLLGIFIQNLVLGFLAQRKSSEPYSFLINDTTLASDNPLRFRKKSLQYIIKIMTIDDH